MNCFFKVTEQGEVIFARYGNSTLAQRHVESVAAATLLNSAPSVERTNTETTERYADMASVLNRASHKRYLDLLNAEDFTPWFSTVTPLTEVGLLPIGSRPAKRGLGAKSLDDLRTIPWVFSWSQARINLAAWYGLGTACEELGDLELLQRAYREWPLFSTFIDNIEMSIAKTDNRIAKMYLALGDRSDLANKVFDEMMLTRSWVLRIVGDAWPLEHRRVLGQAVRVRNPFVDALSLAQVRALREVRANQDELSEEAKAEYMSLVLETVTGVSAVCRTRGNPGRDAPTAPPQVALPAGRFFVRGGTWRQQAPTSTRAAPAGAGPRHVPDLRIDIAYASHRQSRPAIGDPGQGRKLMTKPG